MRDELFEHIQKMEEQIASLNSDFLELKQRTVSILEENVRLEMENKNYEQLLKEYNKKETEGASFKENTLQSLYDEGFHVCSVKFGMHRHGDSCLFCQEFLSRRI